MNGLSPGRRQAIIRTIAGISLILNLGTKFSDILSEIDTFSFKKMHLKMSAVRWRPFCLGLRNSAINVADLKSWGSYFFIYDVHLRCTSLLTHLLRKPCISTFNTVLCHAYHFLVMWPRRLWTVINIILSYQFADGQQIWCLHETPQPFAWLIIC